MDGVWQERIHDELGALRRAERREQLSMEDHLLRAGSYEQQAAGAPFRPGAQVRCWLVTVSRLLAGRWGTQRAALSETAATRRSVHG
jgi:hypothetical protein